MIVLFFSTSLSLFFFSNYLFFRGVQQQAGLGGAGRDGTDASGDSNARRDGGAGRPDGYVFCYFFVLLSTLLFSSSHSSSFPILSFSVNYNNKRGGAGRGGTGRDRRGQRQQRETGRGAGGREEEVGEGRKAGWRGTWGQLRRRGRRPKEASGNLDGRTAAEDEAGGRAGQGGGRATLLLSCLRLGYLFKASTIFPKYNALQML